MKYNDEAIEGLEGDNEEILYHEEAIPYLEEEIEKLNETICKLNDEIREIKERAGVKMREMTHDDCKNLKKVEVAIVNLIQELCVEYNDHRRQIDYLHLCALIVLSGKLNGKFPGAHNNVATVSNILCIPYEVALDICDDMYMLRHLQEFTNGCDIKLTTSGLAFITSYIDDNLFKLFRDRLFRAINYSLYPGDSSPGVSEDDNAKLNIMTGVYACGSVLYEKILELPCVALCYYTVTDTLMGCG